MSLVPIDWSVVIVGRWNRAILTPAGIGKRLFGLEEGTPLEVILAIDAIAPPRVAHEGITVVAGSDRLIVQPSKCIFRDLERARLLARKALSELPETPVSAVGLNVKYNSSEPLEPLALLLESPWDNQLSDENYSIGERSISRSLSWNNGVINLSVSMNEDGEQLVQFNFDFRSSEVAKQETWLATPIADVESEVKKLLKETMGLNQGDVADES
jgi:hypothetical protein